MDYILDHRNLISIYKLSSSMTKIVNLLCHKLKINKITKQAKNNLPMKEKGRKSSKSLNLLNCTFQCQYSFFQG